MPDVRAPAEVKAVVGEQGLIVMIYSGIMAMLEIHGPVTRAKYRFGVERPKGFVDARDLSYFLAFEEFGKLVFNVE